MIQYTFNPGRALQSASRIVLALRDLPPLSPESLTDLLYLADRQSLAEHGYIVAALWLKPEAAAAILQTAITTPTTDDGELSVYCMWKLDAAVALYRHLGADAVRLREHVLHLPERQGGAPVDPAAVLRVEGWDEAEIEAVAKEESSHFAFNQLMAGLSGQ